MNIFEPQTSLKNYTYPVVKLIISILIIFACVFRNRLFHIDGKILNVLVSIICFFIGIVCIVCIYISVYEMFNVFEYKSAQIENTNDVEQMYIEQMNIEEIIHLVNVNDIVEIKIKYNNDTVLIGSSSDCKNGSNVFFDKKFYCKGIEFDTLEDFAKCLEQYSTNNIFLVVSIDGIAPFRYRH